MKAKKEKKRCFKKRRQKKRKLMKAMVENLKKAYEVCAELDKHSIVTRKILEQRFDI